MIKLLAFIIVILTISCTTVKQSHYNEVERNLSNNNYDNAIKIIEENKDKEYGKDNRVLYYMNLGWVYHLKGSLIDTQESLKKADDYIQDLFTKSMSKNVASTVTNNKNILPYEGEDFEKIAVNIIKALDYAYHGKLEDATVEARKINEYLNFFNAERKVKTAYQEDAFGRYLAGILYESQKQYNDAYLSYFKAYKTYKRYELYYKTKTPMYLKKSLKRLMVRYATDDDLSKLKIELQDVKTQSLGKYKKRGRFLFILYNGYVPKKVSKSVYIDPRDYKISYDRISMNYPTFQRRYHQISYAKVFINNSLYKTEVVHPIEVIAIRDLNDRLKREFPGMVLKKVNRLRAEKILGKKEVKKEIDRNCSYILGRRTCNYSSFTNSDTFGYGNLASIPAVDQADLRSWRFLPAEIDLADISLTPGKYNVRIEFYSKNGHLIDKTVFNSVNIEAEKEVFKWYRTTR